MLRHVRGDNTSMRIAVAAMLLIAPQLPTNLAGLFGDTIAGTAAGSDEPADDDTDDTLADMVVVAVREVIDDTGDGPAGVDGQASAAATEAMAASEVDQRLDDAVSALGGGPGSRVDGIADAIDVRETHEPPGGSFLDDYGLLGLTA